MKTFTTSLLLLLSIFQAAYSVQTYTPDWPDFVVAKWEYSEPVFISSEHIAELIQEAKYPGNSANFALAKNLLQQQEMAQKGTQKAQSLKQHTEHLYQKAVVAQYFHQFDVSNNLLDKVIQQQPKHSNAILLKANMQLLLGEYEQALLTCTRLIGLAEQSIVAACGNFAKAQQGNIKENLNSLMAFLKSQTTSSQEVAVWLAEIQANLAKDAGDFELANTILAPYAMGRVPVSFWVLWADIQIALNKPEFVLSKLGAVVKENKNKDDALLLRLAIAEKQLQLPRQVWLGQAAARISLREKRQDNEHAYDIALYYLYIKEDAKTAQTWAEINWQQAKLLDDAHLLELTQGAINLPHFQAGLLQPLLMLEGNMK